MGTLKDPLYVLNLFLLFIKYIMVSRGNRVGKKDFIFMLAPKVQSTTYLVGQEGVVRGY